MKLYQQSNYMTEIPSKPFIVIRPPLPHLRNIPTSNSPQLQLSPRQPHLTRTNSNSKPFKKVSTQKSIRQKQIEKVLKYAKNSKVQQQSESIHFKSSKNIAEEMTNHLNESQQTIQKIRTYSQQKKQNVETRKASVDKYDELKQLDSASVMSIANSNKRSAAQKNDDYYIYWKSKAYEYLDSNMALMQQVRKLARENQQLKQVIQKGKIRQKHSQQNKQKTTSFDQNQLNNQIRKMSLLYLNKIDQMEKELKRKSVIIFTYQAKLYEMNNAIQGDAQRTKLMHKMVSEIQELKSKNQQLIADIRKPAERRQNYCQHGLENIQKKNVKLVQKV